MALIPETALPERFRIGYCTSGLALHRLDDALSMIADAGYRGVFLTLDVHHLNPFSENLASEVQRIASLLARLGLEAVVETGARFILDPWRKHWPSLVVEDPDKRRERFLQRSIDIARDLGSKVVSFWSGGGHESEPAPAPMQRLLDSLEALLERSESAEVELALEPEPGMLIETVEDFEVVRMRLGSPKNLKLSLDCGHLLVTGEGDPADVIMKTRDLLGAVAIEDMKRGVHEHLPFGEGDMDMKRVIEALRTCEFEGVVAVELGRHSHEGPKQLLHSKAFLEGLGVRFRGSP